MTSLNDIVIDEINDPPQQFDYSESIASFRTVPSEITSTEHSSRLPECTTNNVLSELDNIEQIDDINPKDSASQLLMKSILPSHNLREHEGRLNIKGCIQERTKRTTVSTL